MNNKIKVIDMPMGTGKTTGIIEYMNSNPNQRYMFVTPYRSERERIQSSCPQLNFCIPDDEYSRLNECNKFISEGKNIATTHALFSLFNTETIDKLLSKDYILIIDEEPDSIFNVLSISTDDLDMLVSSGYISLIENNYQIVLNEDITYTGSIETYNNISKNIDKYNFYLVDRQPYSKINLGIISVMDSKIFACFKEIYILTYLFKDSNYNCYCRLYNIQYEYYHFDNKVLKTGLFDDSNFRCRTKDLIKLYSNNDNGGRLNFKQKDNDKTVSLTKNWYNKANRAQKKACQR